MTPALRRINNAMSLMIDNFERTQRASGKAVNTKAFYSMRQEVGKSNAALDEIERHYQSAAKGQENLNRSISNGESKADGLLNKIKGIAAAYIGVKGASELADLSDTMSSNEARLNLIVDDKGSVEELQQKIYRSAENARASYTDTMATVAKLGLTAGKSFTNNDELIKFTELVGKNFKVGGASSTEQSSGMYQLTQAMSSGRLQGDEYRSIIENAPLLAKSIEDYMTNVKKVKGTMKEWASDGLLTADVIKSAVFNSADEVEERFNSIPKTWSDIWTSMKNQAIIALNPLLKKISELANNKNVKTTVNGITNALCTVSTVAADVFGMICSIYSFMANNWSLISPIIWGIAAALIAYGTYLAITNTLETISNINKGIAAVKAYQAAAANTALAASEKTEAMAKASATAAQYGFNAALLSCPLTWILLAIIAIIAVIYMVVAAINKVTGSTTSATGVIIGAFASVGAFLWNLVLGCLELILGVINYLINPFIEIANFIGNVFVNPVSSIIYLFQGMADNVLSILQTIASALDFIFGSNMADTVQSWRDGLKVKADELVAEYAPEENYKDVINNLDLSVDDFGLSRWAYSDAYKSGRDVGEGIDNKISNLLNSNKIKTSVSDYDFSNLNSNVESIAGDAKGISDSVTKSTEELEYLRDIAERKAVNRFTTAEVKIDMTGMTNKIDKDMDIDGVVEHLTTEFVNALTTASEGVHS